MAGKTFGIADDNRTDIGTKSMFQGIRFRAGRTAAGRRVRFMRNKYQLLGNIGAVQAVFFFSRSHQAVHDISHVVYVNAGNVETAIGNFSI